MTNGSDNRNNSTMHAYTRYAHNKQFFLGIIHASAAMYKQPIESRRGRRGNIACVCVSMPFVWMYCVCKFFFFWKYSYFVGFAADIFYAYTIHTHAYIVSAGRFLMNAVFVCCKHIQRRNACFYIYIDPLILPFHNTYSQSLHTKSIIQYKRIRISCVAAAAAAEIQTHSRRGNEAEWKKTSFTKILLSECERRNTTATNQKFYVYIFGNSTAQPLVLLSISRLRFTYKYMHTRKITQAE